MAHECLLTLRGVWYAGLLKQKNQLFRMMPTVIQQHVQYAKSHAAKELLQKGTDKILRIYPGP